eukprot:926966-Pleurochrysis_carterae.AAC.3
MPGKSIRQGTYIPDGSRYPAHSAQVSQYILEHISRYLSHPSPAAPRPHRIAAHIAQVRRARGCASSLPRRPSNRPCGRAAAAHASEPPTPLPLCAALEVPTAALSLSPIASRVDLLPHSLFIRSATGAHTCRCCGYLTYHSSAPLWLPPKSLHR